MTNTLEHIDWTQTLHNPNPLDREYHANGEPKPWADIVVRSAPQIVREVAEKHGLTVEQIKTRTHKRAFSWPRQELMYRLKTDLRWSLPHIGTYLGMHHTTALYGIRKHKARMAIHPSLRDAA